MTTDQSATRVEARVCESMSDRPTPQTNAITFDPYPWNQNGQGRSHCPEVMYPCDDGEWVKADHSRTLERQRDAYAETLQIMARGLYCDTRVNFIRNRHPEIAP